jgi:beta-lactamase regulating signal transducer with metallopeptidase domain
MGAMESVLGIVAVKACAALLLALAAVLAGRSLKRPALVHALWIVVLLELLVPPLLEVGVLPRTALFDSGHPQPLPAAAVRAAALGDVPEPAASTTGPEVDSAGASLAAVLPIALVAIWAAGTLCVLILAACRVRRFGRLLVHATEPPGEMRAAARKLAARLQLARCPRIRLVPATISPMLRPRLGSLEVLFPSTLLARLSRGERDALVAHELAHVRRGDHWVRLLELTAGALFWWHPVVWWARRRLRRVEEQCCDGLVLDTLPGHARDYAKGLIKTVEYLAAAHPGLPALASGIGGARNLEERLTMIMKRRLPKRLSRLQRFTLAAAAGALLLVLPTWADRSDERAAELREYEEQLAATQAEMEQSMLALERQALELEEQLREVRARQQELQMELMRESELLETRRLEAEAAGVEAAGHAEEAARLRREQKRLQEQFELEANRARIERDLQSEILAREMALRRLVIEAQESAARGDHERAARLERDARDLELVLQEEMQRSQAEHAKLQQQQAELERDYLRQELALAEDAGRRDEARELARELERMERERAEFIRQVAREDRLGAMRRQLAEMAARLETLQAEGHDDRAAELERKIEQMHDELADEELDRED